MSLSIHWKNYASPLNCMNISCDGTVQVHMSDLTISVKESSSCNIHHSVSLTPPYTRFRGATFSPDGHTVLVESTSENGDQTMCHMMDVKSQRNTTIRIDSPVSAMAVCNQATRIALAKMPTHSSDFEISASSPSSPVTWNHHTVSRVSSLSLNADGTVLAASLLNYPSTPLCTVQVWNLTQPPGHDESKMTYSLEERPERLAINDAGTLLAVGHGSSITVLKISEKAMHLLARLDLPPAESQSRRSVTDVGFTGDSLIVQTPYAIGTAHIPNHFLNPQ